MITIYMGRSAAGKDYHVQRLIREGAKPIISYTTRPMRDGEREGREYHFVTDETFMEMQAEGRFAECRSYDTLVGGVPAVWRYGSLYVDPKEDHVVILDPQGTCDYIRRYGPENVRVVYVVADDAVREVRAEKRGSFDETEWGRRKEDDDKVFAPNEIEKIANMLGRKVEVIINHSELELELARKTKAQAKEIKELRKRIKELKKLLKQGTALDLKSIEAANN